MKSKFKTFDELPLSLCADDVAGVLGISRAGAYTLIKSKDFPKIKIGGRYVVPRDKFINWINQNSTCGGNQWAV
jgi:predicted DNA-binding transcriptional regulator AlpA